MWMAPYNDAENIKKLRPKKYPQYGLFLMDFFHEFFFFHS